MEEASVMLKLCTSTSGSFFTTKMNLVIEERESQ
jgi:hypothetical protein